MRTRKDIPATAKVVYLALTHRARIGRGKDHAFPSMRCLAEDTGQDTRTCQRAVNLLAELGYLAVEHRKRENGSGKSNCYHLAPLYIPDRGGSGNSVTPPVGNLSPLEAEKGEAEKTTSADKPRDGVSEKPTTEAVREYTREPAEEEQPYNSLARPKKPPKPRLVTLGGGARELWEEFVGAPGVGPHCSSWTPATLAKAGKTVLALKDSPFADKTLTELMPLLVARLKTCNPFVHKSVNFGWLFCADAPNLARMLAGDWDTEAGQVERPKRREVPLCDLYPGMDVEEYWRQKDAAQRKEEGDL